MTGSARRGSASRSAGGAEAGSGEVPRVRARAYVGSGDEAVSGESGAASREESGLKPDLQPNPRRCRSAVGRASARLRYPGFKPSDRVCASCASMFLPRARIRIRNQRPRGRLRARRVPGHRHRLAPHVLRLHVVALGEAHLAQLDPQQRIIRLDCATRVRSTKPPTG